jgi:hypothetical protein
VLAQSLLHFGIVSVDAVILNHGTLGQSKRIEETCWDEWEGVMRVNVGSYVAMVSLEACKGALRLRVRRVALMEAIDTAFDSLSTGEAGSHHHDELRCS